MTPKKINNVLSITFSITTRFTNTINNDNRYRNTY